MFVVERNRPGDLAQAVRGVTCLWEVRVPGTGPEQAPFRDFTESRVIPPDGPCPLPRSSFSLIIH